MKKLFFVIALLSYFDSSSQYQLGVSTGNYAGTNGMYLNPSSIADSRYKVYVNIAGINHGITNNYARWTSTMPYWAIYTPSLPIPDAWKTKLTDNRIDLKSETPKLVLITNQSDTKRDVDVANFSKAGGLNVGDPKLKLMGNVNFDVPILASQFDVPKLNATLGFGIRNRVMLDVRNLSEISAKFLAIGTNNKLNAPYVNQVLAVPQSLNLKFSILKETSFSFAKVVFNDDEKQLKIGGSFKMNGGVYHLGMKYDSVYFLLTSAAKGSLGNEDINQINVVKGNFASMHISPDANLKTFASNFTNPLKMINPFSIFDKNQFSGLGFGLDLGVTYEVLDPDVDFSSRKFKNIAKTQNKYILKIAASINDLGFTKYRSNSVGEVNQRFNIAPKKNLREDG